MPTPVPGKAKQAVDLLRQKLPEFEDDARRRCEIAHAEAVYANGQREEARPSSIS